MLRPWILRLAFAAGAGALTFAQGPVRTDAVPRNAVDAIITALATHAIVALGESGHGNEQSHHLRMQLLREPRLPDAVNDLVVEFGSGRYQDVADRFVRGEAVEEQALRKIWQDTTVPDYLWDRPIYEQFFREVRTINASLPAERRLRVLLGDPPIEWERVRTSGDLLSWQRQRVTHAVDVVKREVIAKNRRALIFYGDGHLTHDPSGQSLVSRIERDTRTRIFSISRPLGVTVTSLQSDVSSWPAPSIASVQGTRIGAAEVEFGRRADGGLSPVLFEQRFDGFLYLGALGSRTTPAMSAALCADQEYMKMRLARMAIDATDRPEELAQECAASR